MRDGNVSLIAFFIKLIKNLPNFLVKKCLIGKFLKVDNKLRLVCKIIWG